MGKILVIGASGNVGRYVAQYAIEMNQEVVAAGVDLEVMKTMFENRAECVFFDFTKPETFASAIENVDRVFMMRPPHLGKPRDLKPFIQALETSHKIKMIAFLSLIGIEKNPVPPHYKIEKYIEQSGIPYCHIRPSFFMQNISGIHAFEIKEFDRIVVPVKNALTSFIDANDIGALTAKVLCEPEFHINVGYSITGSEALSYWDVEKILSEELGRQIIYSNPKPKVVKKYWVDIRGLDKEYCFVMGMLYMMTRMGTAKKVTNTFEKIMEKQPRSFREFVKDNKTVWMKSL